MSAAIPQEWIDLIDQGHLAQAKEKLLERYREDKKDARVLFLLGLIHFKQDDYDQAIEYLTKSVELDDSNDRAYEILGQAYGFKAERAGIVKSAMLLSKMKKAFQSALELNDQALGALEGLFMFHLFAPGVAGGDQQKAMEYLDRIKQVNPARGHLAQALLYGKQKQPEKAEQEFDQAVAKGGDDADVLMKAGRFYMNYQKFDKAQQALERYVALKPEDPSGRDALGDLMLHQQKPQEALDYFNRAVELNASFYPAIFNKGRALKQLGRKEEARQAFQQVIQMDKKNPMAAKAKQELQSL